MPAPQIEDDIEEIAPEMLVALDRPPMPMPGRSPAGSASMASVPAAVDPPRFFNIPIAPSSTPIPSSVFERAPARASSRMTPHRLWRPAAAKGPDSTSIVSPLPPPISRSPQGAVLAAPAPPPRVPLRWKIVGLSAIATGVAISTVLLLMSPQRPKTALSQVASDPGATAGLAGSPAATAPQKATLTAPSKQRAEKPPPSPRPRVATNFNAKSGGSAPKPPATSRSSKPAAPPANKPALASVHERTATPAAKLGALAPKPSQQPGKIDPKKPGAPATKANAAVTPKLATQTTKSPALTTTSKRTVRPVLRSAASATSATGPAEAKAKAVADADPKPAVTKRNPASR